MSGRRLPVMFKCARECWPGSSNFVRLLGALLTNCRLGITLEKTQKDRFGIRLKLYTIDSIANELNTELAN